MATELFIAGIFFLLGMYTGLELAEFEKQYRKEKKKELKKLLKKQLKAENA